MNEMQQAHSLGKVEGMLSVIMDDNEKARDDRKKLYHRIEMMERTQERIEKKLDGQEARISSIEVPIENFSKWRERFIGMGLVWTVIAGFVGSVATYYWQKIIAIITG